MARLSTVLTLAVSLVALPDAAARPEAIPWTIALHGDRLTVRVTEAPLGSVLRALEQRSGIRVSVDNGMDERISVAFENLPLAEGVRRLVGSRPVAFVYAVAAGGGLRLVEVMIYARGADDTPGAAGSRRRAETAASHQQREPGPLTAQPERATSGPPNGEADLSNLLGVLKRDPSPDAREDALDALQDFSEAPAELLAETALQDPAPSVRLKALRVLGAHPGVGRPTIAAVMRAASSDPDETVRDTATDLLESLVEE